MDLRYYQRDGVEAGWAALRRGAHPIIELPTGAGKSLVIAEIAKLVLQKGGRVLVATHVKELVAGNAAEFQRLTSIEPGILCAGLERTDKGHDVLFASVQSIYGPAKKGEIPPFDLILIDECHLVSDKDSEAKFYPTLFKCFPGAQRLGLSATPSRGGEPVWGEGKYFTERAYVVSVLELVQAGFLSPLIGVQTCIQLDTDELKTTAGEYDPKSAEKQETDAWLLAVVKSVKDLAAGRAHIGVFCPTVNVAERMTTLFNKVWGAGGAEFVVGDTEDRTGKLDRWKAGEFPVMCSVNVLSTGFNFPQLDCIVTIRPTKSQELWRQILGRGTRIHKSKTNCLVLDYAGNLMLHGGICAGTEEVYAQKPDGELEKVEAGPRPKPKRSTAKAAELVDLDPMLAHPKGARVAVRSARYAVIGSRDKPGKRMVVVTYKCDLTAGVSVDVTQFVCTEYDGYALEMARRWFAARGVESFPRRADAAQAICYGLPVPRELNIRKVGKYINVVAEQF